jgi:hypothetical protein
MSRVSPELSITEQQWEELFNVVVIQSRVCRELSTLLSNNSITEHSGQQLLNGINKVLNDIKDLSHVLDDGPRADLLRVVDLIQQELSEHYGTTAHGGTPERYEVLEFTWEQLRGWHRALLNESIQEDIRRSSCALRELLCATVRSNTANNDQDQRPDRLQKSGLCRRSLRHLVEWLRGKSVLFR